METLTKNQMLCITRLGQGLSLEKIAKKVFLSTSYVSLMENNKREVPDFLEDMLNFKQGIRWYQTIVTSLLDENSKCTKEDVDEALKTLNKILKI